MAGRIPKKQIGIYAVIILVLLLLIAGGIVLKGYLNQKNEKPYTDESELNDLVYADIVSIVPTDGKADAKEKNPQSYIGYFCDCETIDGVKLSAYMSKSDFDRYIISSNDLSDPGAVPESIEFDTPMRIHGRVSNRKRIDGSSDSDELLFEIYKAEQLTVFD